MSLGDRIDFLGGSYEIRGMIDGRYVVRIRNREKNRQSYRVWTETDKNEFDRNEREKVERADRNTQIYERKLAGETMVALAREFGISTTTVRQVCVKRERQERAEKR